MVDDDLVQAQVSGENEATLTLTFFGSLDAALGGAGVQLRNGAGQVVSPTQFFAAVVPAGSNTPGTLVARSGNRFKLNDGLRENLWVSAKPTCSSLFPLLTSERTADVVIEDLTLDGNRQQNE